MKTHIRGFEVRTLRRNFIPKLTTADYYAGLFFLMITVFVAALLGARLLIRG